ncbi:uncharacterized protein LOC124933977 [Impatiens glandulifera]|uniref:uncharacterized protein LOC124933977 n=1 Tax=Impatiens glandulifera TaxID=253017 RepID=UPI001FB1699E|nr:uncharacterized protein LOC124933977 [Impatiens glandulifera]XP_047330388.1 uncharacterized protein LOC124933977 [Impatiens glandulifera]
MSFLLRSSQTAAVASAEYRATDATHTRGNTLEGLIGPDSILLNSIAEDQVAESEEVDSQEGIMEKHNPAKDSAPIVQNHIDVTADEGYITIPYKELPDDWMEAPDIHSFHTLDRGFVFPGEQVHILACLSTCKQDMEIITPFKVAAVMSKNGIGQGTKKENEDAGSESELVHDSEETSPSGQEVDQSGDNVSKEQIDRQKNVSDGEMLLRREVQRRQTETLLQKIENSHFFVRIVDSDEPLWEKRETSKTPVSGGTENRTAPKNIASINSIIERGSFDASVSGGLARSSRKCCSLSNGDIVVLLLVNIGVEFVKDPFLEIYQFEKFKDKGLKSEDHSSFSSVNEDPCGDLLKWLLPVDNSIHLPAPSLPPIPAPSSNSSIRSISTRSNFSSASSSQLFSFNHFRSYSMSAMPPTAVQQPPASPSTRPDVDLQDWDQFPSFKLPKSTERGFANILSFRGVTLEPERFSVRCGLEGIFTPGRRWRRKIEVIQPIEIHSFAADCNTDDLLCIQIKNVAPAHLADIVVYLDAISVVYEEAPKGGPPVSLPIACIEAGDGHNLPNLTLRRGEEHSFILKPVTSVGKTAKANIQKNSQLSLLKTGSISRSSKRLEVKENASVSDQFAVLVSCRCNYTESRLFFKQSTNWRPRVSRDLMISVASEMSRKNLVSDGIVPQLPVQVLTLHASNLTSEDVTMTVHAPASFTSPPTVVSINSCPSTPMSPFVGHFDPLGRAKQNGESDPHTVALNENDIPGTESSCTHLWLHSRVPLGCVPAKSMATIKLELLPLTDGIITLDSLQIHVKERGLTYVPEHSLKINATSSIATGIM